MICKNCGNTIPDDSEFCPFCGNVVKLLKSQDSTILDIDTGYNYLELKQWKKATEIFETAIINNRDKSMAYIGKLLAKLKYTDIESLNCCSRDLNSYDEFKKAFKYADNEFKENLLLCNKICLKNKTKKSRKRLIIIAASVVLLLCTYFVFVPAGRYFYYDNLLSNGNAQKAAKSYTKSFWFEYDSLAKTLFYENGMELFDKQDYKKAEICFDVAQDVSNYSNYCKAKNLLAEKDLKSYEFFIKCKGFLDSDEILSTNEHFVILNKLQGKWYHPALSFDEVKESFRKKGHTVKGDVAYAPKDREEERTEDGIVLVSMPAIVRSIPEETRIIEGIKMTVKSGDEVISYDLDIDDLKNMDFIDDTHLAGYHVDWDKIE